MPLLKISPSLVVVAYNKSSEPTQVSLVALRGECPVRAARLKRFRLGAPAICIEFHFLKLWNACDRPEHKKAGL